MTHRAAPLTLTLALTVALGCGLEDPSDAPCPAPGTVLPVSDPTALLDDPMALSNGFEVPRIELEIDDDGRFTLEVPDDAIYATCAAFRCQPRFDRGTPPTVESELLAPQLEIANFGECVVAYQHFVSSPVRFSLDELSLVPPTPPCDAPGVPTAAVETARSAAPWLGCWVYDPTSIVQATTLETIPGPGLGLAEACNSAPPEAVGCVRDDGVGVGVCVTGRCEPWCSASACPSGAG